MGGVTADWLAQLAPPHAPPPPGWWPLAPGWWGLLILLAAMVAVFVYWRQRRPVRLRRAALRELKALRTTVSDDSALARELEHLLRRYAVARFGRDAVAALCGERWIAFVVAHGGAAWSGDSGAGLLRAAYGGRAAADRAAWLQGAEQLIRQRA